MRRNRWTDEEISLLSQNKDKPRKELCIMIPNHSPGSITQMLHDLRSGEVKPPVIAKSQDIAKPEPPQEQPIHKKAFVDNGITPELKAKVDELKTSNGTYLKSIEAPVEVKALSKRITYLEAFIDGMKYVIDRLGGIRP